MHVSISVSSPNVRMSIGEGPPAILSFELPQTTASFTLQYGLFTGAGPGRWRVAFDDIACDATS